MVVPSTRFGATPEQMLTDERISKGHVLATYQAIQFHTKGLSGTAWPGHERIARLSHNSVSTVRRDIEELVALGYLRKTHRPGTSNHYEIIPNPTRTDPVQDEQSVHPEQTTLSRVNNEQEQGEQEQEENHLSLSSNVSTEEAVRIAQDVLGAEVIEERETPPLQEGAEDERLASNTGEHNRRRAVALEKAQTEKPMKLWLAFNPENAGYLQSDFKREFPLLDYRTVLARFLDYYLDAKPKTNWMATFFAYATEAQRRAAEEESKRGVETDSMGLPLDPSRRRVGDTPEKREQRLANYQKMRERFDRMQEEEDGN